MRSYDKIEAPWWDDKPVAIVGAGPSLRGFDFERLRGPWYTVAVNQKVLDLPWADACVSVDTTWIDGEAQGLAFTQSVPLYVAGPDNDRCPRISRAINLRRSRTQGLSDALDTVEMGGTSGYAALNIAYLKRARFVVLFGFDYTAAHGDHDKPAQYPWHKPGHNARYWPRWAKNFNETLPQLERAGVRVLNASPLSTIVAFPKCSPEVGLLALRRSDHGGDPITVRHDFEAGAQNA